MLDFKDHLLNRRFNQQTFQLDLSHLVDDEGNIKRFCFKFEIIILNI